VPIIAIEALIAAAIFLAGFGGGWGVKGWKDGAEVARAVAEKEKVESRNAILQTANANCATDIEGVRQGVKVITDAVADREKAASEAMKNAQALAGKHVAQIVAIKALPVVPEAGQCDAIIQEQKEYVAARKRE
jgi:hypothetical protein